MTDPQPQVGSDFTPRVSALAETTATNRFSRFENVGAVSRAAAGASRFADQIIASRWQAPSRAYASVYRGPVFGQRGASSSWIFPRPWYADELEWVASAHRPLLAQEPDQTWQAPPAIHLADVAPTLSFATRTPAPQARRRAFGYRPMLGAAVQRTQPAVEATVPQHSALASIAEDTPAAFRHLAWADDTLADTAASDPVFGASAAAPRSQRARLVYVDTFSPEPRAEGMPSASSLVVDESEPVTMEEILSFVAPKPTLLQPRRGISRSPAARAKRRLPVTPRAGIAPSLAASPMRTHAGVQANETLPVSDMRVFDATPRVVVERTPMGHSLRAYLGGIVAETTRTGVPATEQTRPRARPLMTYVAPEQSGTHTRFAGVDGVDATPAVSDDAVNERQPVADLGYLARAAERFLSDSTRRTTTLAADYVAPELVLAATEYGLAPQSALAANHLALAGTPAIRAMAHKVDMSFVAALQPRSAQPEPSAWSATPTAWIDTNDTTGEVDSTQALVREPMASTAPAATQQRRLPRGAFLFPEGVAAAMDVAEASIEERAALDVVAAQRIAQMPVVAPEVVATNDNRAQQRGAGTEATLEPGVDRDVLVNDPVLIGLRRALLSSPEGRAASPAVRVAKAMVALRSLTGETNPEVLTRQVSTYLPVVFAGHMPASNDAGFEASGDAAQATPQMPMGTGGRALRELVAPKGAAARGVEATPKQFAPVLHAPSMQRTMVKGEAPRKAETPAPAPSAATTTAGTADQVALPDWFKKAAQKLMSQQAGTPEEIIVRELALVKTAPERVAAKTEETESVTTYTEEERVRFVDKVSDRAQRIALERIKELIGLETKKRYW